MHRKILQDFKTQEYCDRCFWMAHKKETQETQKVLWTSHVETPMKWGAQEFGRLSPMIQRAFEENFPQSISRSIELLMLSCFVHAMLLDCCSLEFSRLSCVAGQRRWDLWLLCWWDCWTSVPRLVQLFMFHWIWLVLQLGFWWALHILYNAELSCSCLIAYWMYRACLNWADGDRL